MNEFNAYEIKPVFNSKFRTEVQANVDYDNDDELLLWYD